MVMSRYEVVSFEEEFAYDERSVYPNGERN
jgi:hypothetical protein